MVSVSQEGSVNDINNRGTDESNKLGAFELNGKDVNGSIENGISKQQKGSKEPKPPVYESMLSMFDDYAANGNVEMVVGPPSDVSTGDVFEVGDMVWAKVKSHPWWPGHVYSEELATASVRRSKREGLLLVAFFGDSSYGWFDPSELVPFDSNFAEKCLQTNSRMFVKAVGEAMDEVSRRSGLGLSCMCRNKQNFRQTKAQGFFAIDVADYNPGAVYSIDAIGKARDSFQPMLALDFVRQLALEPTGSEDDDLDFIKNKATLMSYRKAVYEEFDETYGQAFGHEPVRASPGSIKESAPGKAPSKAPLSGREVFADKLGKVKSPAKTNKVKDHAKKDKYLFKRRDETKDMKMHQKEKGKVTTIAAGDYTLQKRVSGGHEQTGITISDGELALKDANASIENTPIVLEFNNPGSETNTSKVESPISSSVAEVVPEMEDRKASSGLIVDSKSSSGPQKLKVSKRPVGELSCEKSILPEKKKKKIKKDGFSSTANKPPLQSALVSNPPIDDLQSVLSDLHSFALDPFHTTNRGSRLKVRHVFLRFRSLVFQKSLNSSPADGDANDTNSSKSPAVTSAANGGLPPVKQQARSSDDPTKGGFKRGPSDRQEEIASKRKKKHGEIRNLTKKIDEPELIKKTEQRAAEPTMLMIRFPLGGSLPSVNELKARFARYGPMDHSGTRIFWNKFTCRVVYRHKAHAQAAYNFVVGSSSLFGNTEVKCCLKEVGVPDPEPPVKKVAKEDPSTGVQLKSILKKSEVAVNGGRGVARVKFMLSEEESGKKEKMNGFSSSCDATMEFNNKNFVPVTSEFTSRPPSCMHYGTPPSKPNMDIAQQMLGLLKRCNDVVTNVTGLLGYVPYHPL